MRTFLLDTCIWSYWFNPNRLEHTKIKQQVESLAGNSVLGISIITWGEIVYGHHVSGKKGHPIQAEYLQFIKSKEPKTFKIDIHTANTYGKLRAHLFDRYAPKEKRKKNLRPEQLVNPVTSLELGIQENDLWIVAQAIVRGLTLVTHDKFTHIREIAGSELHTKDWAR